MACGKDDAFAQTNDTAPYEISCERRPDGLLEIGCWGFATCINGSVDVHACPLGTVLDRETMTCLRPGEGQTDCHLPTDCVGKADGSYADLGDGCISYYRCFRGLNMGRFYCPAPTAFNEDYGICDYVNNLRPPCGFVRTAARTTIPVVPAVILNPVPAAATDVVPDAVSPDVPATVTPVVPATVSPFIPAVASPFVPATVPPVVPVVSFSVVPTGGSTSTSTFAP